MLKSLKSKLSTLRKAVWLYRSPDTVAAVVLREPTNDGGHVGAILAPDERGVFQPSVFPWNDDNPVTLAVYDRPQADPDYDVDVNVTDELGLDGTESLDEIITRLEDMLGRPHDPLDGASYMTAAEFMGDGPYDWEQEHVSPHVAVQNTGIGVPIMVPGTYGVDCSFTPTRNLD